MAAAGGERRLDVAALNAAWSALEATEAARHALHAQLLRQILTLHRVHTAAGWELATSAELALVRQCSEQTAADLLVQAQVLGALPEGLASLEQGLLTTEQCAVLARLTGDLDADVRAQIWHRLRTRLLAARASGEVLSPARVRALIAGWIIAADPRGAQERREAAARGGDVDDRRRDDGLVDLFAIGIGAVNARAILTRLRDRAAAWGSGDERPAGQRRLDALVDLLLGRDQLPVDGAATGSPCCVCGHAGGLPRQAARCGCLPGQPAPCGVGVTVLVPIGAALGTTDELATLVGHGPLDPAELAQVLAAGPRLRGMWVDEDGVPVAEGALQRPARSDPAGLRAALLRLALAPPPEWREPRHRQDHRPHPASDSPGAHPPGAAGPYRPGAAEQRLLRVRAPLCEWPGCGATVSDLDHDVPWPQGPTCGCNLGPLCRRHHRLKQLLMVKQRLAGGVRWTHPTGRSWTRPTSHEPPAVPRRRLRDVAADLGADVVAVPGLRGGAQGERAASGHDDAGRAGGGGGGVASCGGGCQDDCPGSDRYDADGYLHAGAGPDPDGTTDTDPRRFELRITSPDPWDEAPSVDPLAAQLRDDQRWGHDLDNPYRWLDDDVPDGMREAG